MKKFKILNSKDIQIINTETSNKPFDETTFDDADTLTVVIIQDPYEYFDQYLAHCIYNEMSPKLQKETLKAMKKLDDKSFLEWFETVNYLPLINPQTFQLDMRKRVDVAIENIESFDYVVPYEAIDTFIENVDIEIQIKKIQSKSLSFDISQLKEDPNIQIFLEKDLLLYQKAIEKWKEIQNFDFKPLHSSDAKNKLAIKTNAEKYEGLVDDIKPTKISGWVFHKENPESLMVGVYKNGVLLETVKADIMRPGVKKNKNHLTGQCGFKFIFKDELLKPTDQIEIKILPDEIMVTIGEKPKLFFIT